MCAVVECPDCRGWRLSACEVHGWTDKDIPEDQRCSCPAAKSAAK